MSFFYRQLFVKPAYPTRMLNGQTVIVTGSNTGLGKEAARHFARLGAAKLILAVRNTKAGEAAKIDIEQTTQCAPGTVEVWPLDLSDYSSVKAFAARAARDLERVDVLCENAGIATDKKRIVGGHESTITVNVVSTFLLALLMLPQLKETARKFGVRPRLTVVASEVHAWAKFPERGEKSVISALDATDDMSDRYMVSKLLEVLVIRQVAPRLEGSGVVLNMLNPGLCHSELSRDSGLGLTVMKFFLARSTEVGSRTLVAAGLAGEESHGKYMSDAVVKDYDVSDFVKSDEGNRAGQKVWEELSQILEEIAPGVTGNI
ncbi:short-chain dehydrogenase reductase [Diaporthe amygdali]|uniref:short-chain dehydrogenase reductase n=1 Tax=Phomopsis amygdali TaxID=1214568 RepID=UPI0022FE00CE|nr:short-chain dehydrogenase reductase [Diaporthe amygdali]KAJ0121131.1 short-chain dehydrogenase reductase [Diaporthe amygdali]